MPEALLGDEPLVAEWDPDAGLYFVRGWVAGPAGTAGLRLSAGIEVDIDVAWPRRLAELRIPTVDGELTERAHRVAEKLLGRSRLWRLLSGRHEEPWPIGGERLRYDGDGNLAPAFRRAALARQIGFDRGQPTIRRAMALLEGSASAEQSGAGLGLRRMRTVDARVGAELLLSVLDDGLPHLDATTAHDVAAVLRRIASTLRDEPRTQARLVALAHDLPPDPHPSTTLHEQAFAAAMVPRDASRRVASAAARALRVERDLMAAPPVPVDRRTLPVALERAVIASKRVSVSEIEVSVRDEYDRAELCWARVFDGDGTLVAMAPFRQSGRLATALLLVSPEALPRAVVDVVDQPTVRRPSAELTSVESAIVAGREAASHERAGRRNEASASWSRSAAAWDAAGDVTRAGTARSYADGRALRTSGWGPRIPRPLIADRIKISEPRL